MMDQKPVRVAIAGLGAIGKSLSSRLAVGVVPGVVLTAVSAKNQHKAREFVGTFAHPVKVLTIHELEAEADIVVECAPADLLPEIIGPFLRAGKKAIVLSAGALLFHRRAQCRGDVAQDDGGLAGPAPECAGVVGAVH